jgi:hypothetical protein
MFKSNLKKVLENKKTEEQKDTPVQTMEEFKEEIKQKVELNTFTYDLVEDISLDENGLNKRIYSLVIIKYNPKTEQSKVEKVIKNVDRKTYLLNNEHKKAIEMLYLRRERK